MMDHTRLRLLVLVLAHIAATIALDQIDQLPPVTVLSDALRGSQIGLLAVWLAVGSSAWPWRIGSFLAGTAALVWWHWTDAFDSLSFFVGPELVVAAGLLIARYEPSKLRLIQLSEPVVPSTRFQFSLRQAMALCLVVAVMLTVAKPIRSYVATVNNTDENEDVDAANRISVRLIGTILSGVVVISWLATWASLGSGGLSIRITLVLLLALALGSLATYCFAPFLDEENPYELLTLFVGQSIITMASLLVVRAGGYRLVGRKEMATQAVTT
jgi:hypothetical protein